MGAKADKIQKELDEVLEENARLRTQLTQAELAATRERARNSRRSPLEARFREPTLSHHDFPGGGFSDEAIAEAEGMLDQADDEAAAAKALAITPAQAHDLATGKSLLSDRDRQELGKLAAALGLPSDTDDLLAIRKSLEGLHRGTNDPAFVKDTLAASIDHNRTERAQLFDDLKASRAIIGRIASALQIGDWNKQTGDELVERVQRYMGLAHWCKKRRSEILKHNDGKATTPTVMCDDARADELGAVLARLVASKDLDKWLAKQPSTFVPSENLVEIAQEGAPPAPAFARNEIVNAVLSAAGETTSPVPWSDAPVARLFKILAAVPSLEEQLTEFVNVVLAPQVAKFASST